MTNDIPNFYQRFNLKSDIEDTKKRFIKRAINLVHGAFPQLETKMLEHAKPFLVKFILIQVSTKLGSDYTWDKLFSDYIGDDFLNCLIALETLYDIDSEEIDETEHKGKVNTIITYAMSLNESDIGIEWNKGKFWPSGAKLLATVLN